MVKPFLKFYAGLFILTVSVTCAAGCNSESPTAPTQSAVSATVGNCRYQILTASIPATIPSSGGTFTLNLQASAPSCSWHTSVSDLLFEFVKFAPYEGQGPSSVVVMVGPHTGVYERTIEFTVASMVIKTTQAAAAALVPGPNAILHYEGSPMDWTSRGQSGVATTDQYRVPWVTVNGAALYRIGMQIESIAPSERIDYRLSIILEAANGEPLKVGRYTNVQSWPGGSQPHPVNSMALSIGYRTCTIQNDEFEIFQIAFNSRSELERLHARMQSKCTMTPAGQSLNFEVWYPSKGAF